MERVDGRVPRLLFQRRRLDVAAAVEAVTTESFDSTPETGEDFAAGVQAALTTIPIDTIIAATGVNAADVVSAQIDAVQSAAMTIAPPVYSTAVSYSVEVHEESTDEATAERVAEITSSEFLSTSLGEVGIDVTQGMIFSSIASITRQEQGCPPSMSGPDCSILLMEDSDNAGDGLDDGGSSSAGMMAVVVVGVLLLIAAGIGVKWLKKREVKLGRTASTKGGSERKSEVDLPAPPVPAVPSTRGGGGRSRGSGGGGGDSEGESDVSESTDGDEDEPVVFEHELELDESEKQSITDSSAGWREELRRIRNQGSLPPLPAPPIPALPAEQAAKLHLPTVLGQAREMTVGGSAENWAELDAAAKLAAIDAAIDEGPSQASHSRLTAFITEGMIL
eukprot:SAG22_NODE_938_length_6405_cov_3.226134_4_plen_392_part_00